jgi:hypothetical protein
VKVIKKPVSEFYKNIFHNLHHSSQDNWVKIVHKALKMCKF